MFVNRLINGGNLPVVEQMLRFTAARHRLLAENVANLSTPGYRQRDVDPAAFQSMLADRVAQRRGRPVASVRFDDLLGRAPAASERGLLFHDGNNRSAEQLMSELSKNALMHNLYAELLNKQFSSIQNALRERVA
ncbi:MAG: flagellar basal body rod protein FlgB [Tepidisphaerales bacterium]